MKYALFCQNESCKSKWHPECLFRKYSVHTLTDDTCNFDLYVTLIKMIAKILQVFLVFFDFSEMTLNIMILMKRHTFIRISRPPYRKWLLAVENSIFKKFFKMRLQSQNCHLITPVVSQTCLESISDLQNDSGVILSETKKMSFQNIFAWILSIFHA